MPQAVKTTITNGAAIHPYCCFNNVLLLYLQLNLCTVTSQVLKSKSCVNRHTLFFSEIFLAISKCCLRKQVWKS